MKKSGSNATLVGRHTAGYQEEVLVHALLVSKEAIDEDPNFGEVGRHARKIMVTALWSGEVEAASPVWQADKTVPVLIGNALEHAIFDHRAVQDRHRHPKGPDGGERFEIYLVTKGTLVISTWDADGNETVFRVGAGGSITICGGVWHQVHRDSEFRAHVITQHPPGSSEKESYITP